MSVIDNDIYPDVESRKQVLIHIVQFAIIQDKSCHDTVLNSAYQKAVLNLAKCISVQKLTSINDEVDQLLIENIDNFVDLVEIFINSSSKLSKGNKDAFITRYNSEWNIEKQFMQSHLQRRNLAMIEKGLEVLIR